MSENHPYQLIIRFLNGEASETEAQQLEDWKSQSAENRQVFQEMENLWRKSELKKQPLEREAAFKKVLAGITQVKSTELNHLNRKEAIAKSDRVVPFRRNFLRVAAMGLLFLGLGFLVYNLNLGQGPEIKTITNLEETNIKVNLADGTQVWLNQNSSLSFPQKFDGQYRKVKLEGEAFFDVSRNEDQAFVIQTDKAIVKVLGTSFNVYAPKDSSITQVNVKSGKVQFFSKNESTKNPKNFLLLTAGEQGLFDHQNKSLLKSKVSNLNYLAWRDGVLEFKSQAIGECLNSIARYYKIDLRMRNPELAKCPLTAQFDEAPLEDVLKVIEQSFQWKIEKVDGVYWINGETC